MLEERCVGYYRICQASQQEDYNREHNPWVAPKPVPHHMGLYDLCVSDFQLGVTPVRGEGIIVHDISCDRR